MKIKNSYKILIIMIFCILPLITACFNGGESNSNEDGGSNEKTKFVLTKVEYENDNGNRWLDKEYTYDAKGNNIEIKTYNSGPIHDEIETFTYDEDGKIMKCKRTNSDGVNFNYTYIYDSKDRIIKISASVQDYSYNYINTYIYSYSKNTFSIEFITTHEDGDNNFNIYTVDSHDNILKREEDNDKDGIIRDYDTDIYYLEYDDDKLIKREYDENNNGTINWNETYTYDNNNNLIKVVRYSSDDDFYLLFIKHNTWQQIEIAK